ncbi:Na+/H+ antiporter [Actinoplanes sp. TRM 88003]|uniref:Na+/H+ antiporter n=1 Tax=Paractinoplanes aksuensis TaxID=2939490 RepID=A0ABT1E496_9ACTN|nr:Na+/H+ antiporter [Actinoplanes aksuensis]MCO8277939.1 Na+/H+ antiporter [Actinoplanes aksuensis]
MLSLLLAVAVGVAVLISTSLARRFRIAPPALLLLAGVLLGFLPALRAAHLPPEAVLLLFLPVLLYWESFTSSLREIRANLRVIVLLSTVLVAATAAVAAVAAHTLGLPWGPAWVLGAAVAPTDATAVGVLGRALPRRLATTLRAESLVNDGTALVIYALAVGVTMGDDEVGLANVSGLFVLAYLGGMAIGAVVAWVAVQVRRRVTDPFQHSILALATPLVAYLVAEAVEASGVLAVVVSGLWVSRASPRLFSAETRQYVGTVMGFLTALANAALFVLVGLEVQSAVRELSTFDLTKALLAVAAVSAAVIGVRFAWMFTSPYVIRLIDRRPVQRTRRIGAKPRTVVAAAGFRGAVSLAAALAVPHSLPDRDVIVFVTAGVIAVTLLVQAPLMPRIVRWAGVTDDGSAEQERRRAEITAVEEAIAALPDLAGRTGASAVHADQLREQFQQRLDLLRGDGSGAQGVARDREVRLAALAHKRATVIRLRDEGTIDDEVLQQILEGLDFEEVQLRHHTFGDHADR